MNDKDSRTTAERTSDREFVVTRTVNGPAHLVFKAWSDPELFKRWWTPKSFGMTILSCEMDVRTGGGYRLVISHPAMGEPMAFFGKYLDVVPNARIVWTNEEGDDEGAVTTVTFESIGDMTLVTWHDLYPSKEALDEALVSGATSGFDEQFTQLEEVLGAQDTLG
ncbi:activator of Hsp90 ATPase 1-like family protein [Asticcacaulis biprosthecium C19]|uniref:Activator of Hsp90 ATPase 1-like family protein n=1 Tax=Asticcacaulis biprosthecium C19 TaxID=715226 RepID=F4QSE6_9CAUL|nr:SRPBCC family protein [Asticcacaulis biprosthecium]EGF89666.1 activator of Hsp90 ATPase 1-like family protein [Asticcacaulis biprosthecium C19]